MKRQVKFIILTTLIILIGIIAFFGFGFYAMEIEDQYGDYQEIYYKSKDTDIIINEETKEFGIVGKNWKRLNVWTKEKDSMDLYTFANKVSYYSKIKVYRQETKIEGIKQMDFSDIQKLITEKKIKLILEHKNE